MLSTLIAFAIIPACTVLNRMRGTTEWKGPLPGRPLWYVSPMIAGLAALILPWPQAVGFGLAYLFWGSFAWGFLFGLGRIVPTDRKISGLEATLLKLSRGNVHIAFCLRMGFALPAAMMTPFALLFPLVALANYEIGWRLAPQAPIRLAEWLTGALWGSLILLSFIAN